MGIETNDHEKRGGEMAAQITDKKRKKIIADYLELGSYNATARLNGISKDTVKRIILACDDFAQMSQQKKEQNTADVLAYIERQRPIVCEILGKILDILNSPDFLSKATPAQLTTALGTLIDKFTAQGKEGADIEDLTPLSELLK